MNRRTMISFIDALFLMLMVFVLLPHQPEANTTTKPPGVIEVEIRWPDSMNTDVDVWLDDPTDDKPVGYSHKEGIVWNLLRDDLGHVRDLGNRLNYENAYTRGAPHGEYQVNVHLYSNIGRSFPVPVEVRISGYFPSGFQVIYTGMVTLQRLGQEITVARFSIDEGGLVPGSVHHIPRNLR